MKWWRALQTFSAACSRRTRLPGCTVDGQPAGYAVYFLSYSTWLGRNGMYLEDLYISPKHRGGGAGKHMLRHLAGIAADSGCGRLEWSVLDWNAPAIAFYQSLGAQPQAEWVRYRMAGETLDNFARQKQPTAVLKRHVLDAKV